MAHCTHRFHASSEDRELIAGLLHRDAHAWLEFERRFDRLVRRQIERVCRGFAQSLGRDDLEEIRAEFHLSMLNHDMRKLRLFDPARGLKLSSWIALLANNAARDHLRSHRRRPTVLTSSGDLERVDDRDLAEDVSSRRRCERVVDQLRSFPPQDQRLLLMLHVEESSVEEIARACGGSAKTVYTRAHRIRSQLRQRCAASAIAA